MQVSYDPAARTTYIKLTDDAVVRTVEVSDLVMVDVNAHHEPVGVEFLTLPNAITSAMLYRVADAFPTLKILMETDRWLLPASGPALVS